MTHVKALAMKSETLMVLGVCTVLALALLPVVASAQPSIDPSLVGSGGSTIFGTGTLSNIIGQVFDFIVFIAAAFVVIFLLWGGISYLMSGGNEEKREAAKQRMITGVIGAAIILGVGVILATLGSFLSGSVG